MERPAPPEPLSQGALEGLLGPPGPRDRGDRPAPTIQKPSSRCNIRWRIVRELQTQLTRIAQIQAQLDHVASGQAASFSDGKAPGEVEH